MLIFDRDVAHQYKLAYVRSLDAKTEDARAAALDLISASLNDPAIFDFDPLLKLAAVSATKGQPLFALLSVFLAGGLTELEAWRGANGGILDKHRAWNSLRPGALA